MTNYKLSRNIDVTPKLDEIGKIVRDMQKESLDKHKIANNYSELGAAIVQNGIDDKTRSRGWPVAKPTETPTEKKML